MAQTEINVSQILPSVSAYQLIGTNSGATANTYLTLTAGSNVTITPSGSTLTIAASGGSGSPGGANTDIQFNNSGVFDGSADLTWNNSTKLLTLGNSGTVITLDAAQGIFTIGDTVNDTSPSIFLQVQSDSGYLSFVDDTSSTHYIDITGDNNGHVAIISLPNTGNVTISTDAATAPKNWVFSTAGILTLPGALNAAANLIQSVANPVSAQDAATKNYVDTHSGSSILAQVKLTGQTADIPITTIFTPSTTGLYAIAGYFVATAGSGSDTAPALNAYWTDDGSTHNGNDGFVGGNTPFVIMAATTPGGGGTFNCAIECVAGQPIQYSVLGGTYTSLIYSVYITIIQL